MSISPRANARSPGALPMATNGPDYGTGGAKSIPIWMPMRRAGPPKPRLSCSSHCREPTNNPALGRVAGVTSPQAGGAEHIAIAPEHCRAPPALGNRLGVLIRDDQGGEARPVRAVRVRLNGCEQFGWSRSAVPVAFATPSAC